ncbi:MAG: alpha/beta hydrolase [Actinomycetota bacterium]|nr:alpha/beta hydrolase [Actinomycetota bacterium]
MRRKAAVYTAVVLALAGCGGDGDPAAEGPTTSTPAADTSRTNDLREVTADAGGRTLTGHCRGTQGDEPAVVLESGIANLRDQLAIVEERLAERTVVCAYDRAGLGSSDPSPTTPRPLSELVSDLDAFIEGAELETPVVLVGHSAGATIVFMYAQAHPDKVAGFVSMNPVPPSKTFLAAARKVETSGEYQAEIGFYSGANDESVQFTTSESMLKNPLPPTMPYAVMFDEDCDGDSEFCGRILPVLTRVTRMLARVGDGGRFVRAKDAGHEIYGTRPELVFQAIEEVMAD